MTEYSHYGYRAVIENRDPLLEKECRHCKADFQTRARLRKYCDACMPVRRAERNAGYDAKKRKARLALAASR